jgi:uncharacterized protein
MSLKVNLRHLEENSLHLKGELEPAELDLDPRDEVIQLNGPLEYDLEVQRLEGGLLLQGKLHLTLDCQCVRCLKPFKSQLDLPAWTLHLPFQGEEALAVVNDLVDLTPYVREDILLEFPQHPLCDPECRGLPKSTIGKAKKAGSANANETGSSAWTELNKLKF